MSFSPKYAIYVDIFKKYATYVRIYQNINRRWNSERRQRFAGDWDAHNAIVGVPHTGKVIDGNWVAGKSIVGN
jgi:hypothetical protein